ncbi:MAG TPA: GNAT family N-acetyltransferase [Bryobacteraceae bacterium]|nr:GNAT family N-acetyltransferase [Bryobacteraceae bacterium]
MEQAWSALCELWRAQRVISVFTRLHPLLENHRLIEPLCLPAGARSESNIPHLRLHGQTVSIDLRLLPEEGFRSYQKILRQNINTGRKAGLVSHIDETWRCFVDFLSIYHRTMARNQADEGYFFPAAYFENLREALDSHVHLMVTSLGGSTAAAVVVLESEEIVQAYLGGGADEFRNLGSFKVLLDDLRLWSIARGKRFLHLGGGRGGTADTLFAFKSHFSHRRHDFLTASFAVEPEVCEEMANERRRYASTQGLEPVSDKFFPIYRVPLVNRGRAVAAGPAY